MKNSPFDFIDTVIDPIPVVGRLWADALYTVMGLSDAFNMRHFNDPNWPVPATRNVLELAPKALPADLPKAA